MLRHRALPVLVAAAVLAGAACSGAGSAVPGSGADAAGAPTSTVPDRWPGPDWPTAAPEEVGLDPAALAALDAELGARRTSCLVVVKDGLLVHEAAWDGTGTETDHEAFSASKSVTSTLVGIAEAQGLLDIDQPASDVLTEWKGTPSETVTIRNLLSNDSGRYYDPVTDYRGMAIEAADKTAFALGLSQQHPPGTHWEYNNSAIQTLEAVLERATGTDMAAFAQRELFEPLGMTAEIRRDAAGNPLAFMGVQASCRDLARFGYLFLRGGRWGDDQLVPAAWVEQATRSSQDLEPQYGLLWWVNPPQDPSWPSLPPDAFVAHGLGGQIVLVVPSWDLVVTRMGMGESEQAGGRGDLVDELGRRLRAAGVDGAG